MMGINSHSVLTADFPDNQKGGILICGINFGYSKADEMLESEGLENVDVRSYFHDSAVNNTRFRNKVVKWLESWGVCRHHIDDSNLKEKFFQTNWVNSQTNSTTSDGKIGVRELVSNSNGFLGLLEERSPSLVIFFGRDLIDALNDISIRGRVEAALGNRHGNASNISPDPLIEGDRNFKVRVQKFDRAVVLCIPHPQTRGLTDEYISRFRKPISLIFQEIYPG